jgi:hypothetical protein
MAMKYLSTLELNNALADVRMTNYNLILMAQ